ncbi:MAG: sulfatase-like hydrolase/transferase [Planctomycetota bacterium]
MQPNALARGLAMLAALVATPSDQRLSAQAPTDQTSISPTPAPGAARPNVLWIVIEDMNAWLGCYGDATVPTPHLDALASRGLRFDRAYMPAPVCSPTRSALVTGAMPTTLGLHHHRSGRAEFRGEPMGPSYDAIPLPDGVRTAPEQLREAGYATFLQGKADYNFTHDLDVLYDGHDGGMNLAKVDLAALWADAKAAGRPFFGQIQLRGGKGRPAKVVDRNDVPVPPYYPDVPVVREEIAHHYDCVAQTDAEVGAILEALRTDGLLERTAVFVFSDHGFRMHRHKQFLYEGGIRVPLLMAGPGIEAAARDDLVSGVDVTATTLAIARVPLARHIEGRDLLAADHEPRSFVVAARDRCDYSIDRIRAIVTPRYKYLRNHLTDRPYMQPQYRDGWRVTVELRNMAASGALDATQMAFYGEARPAEELYDLTADPHEVANLVDVPAHAEALAQHRALLAQWIATTGDRGQQTESYAGLRAVLRRWDERCVNPEFDAVRERLRQENAGLPRVLILGDSISMGYTPHVTIQLEGAAVVMRPRENCEGTTHGVKRIGAWLALGEGRWDVIYCNFGLHDLKRVDPQTGRNSDDPSHPRQAAPDVYEQQLQALADRLRETGAKLIFATTTPVPEGVRPRRDPEDVDLYNAIARRVMGAAGAAIHDLGAWAAARPELQRARDVHFTRAGSEALAAEVTRRLREALAPR